MFCKNCGSKIEDGARFCPSCGTAVESAAPVTPAAEPVAQPVQAPVQEPVYVAPAPAPVQAPDNSTSVLVMGILAVALCEFGILGIIFGAIGLGKAKAFLLSHGILFGKAKVGRILSKVGLIVGIIMTVFWLVYFIFLGALIGNVHYYY